MLVAAVADFIDSEYTLTFDIPVTVVDGTLIAFDDTQGNDLQAMGDQSGTDIVCTAIVALAGDTIHVPGSAATDPPCDFSSVVAS